MTTLLAWESIFCGLPIAVVCRISVTGRGPFSKASARIWAVPPICFIKASLLTADLLVPVTNASLKLRKQRKRSTCLQQIPHQTRTELLLTISPFNQRSLGPSAHFQVRNVFSDTPRDIVILEVDCDCVKMLRSSKLKVAKWCCCLNVFIHSICVNHPVFNINID